MTEFFWAGVNLGAGVLGFALVVVVVIGGLYLAAIAVTFPVIVLNERRAERRRNRPTRPAGGESDA